MTTKNDAGVKPLDSDLIDQNDAPELTDEFFADAEMFKADAFVKRGRGRPPTGNAKEMVSFRLDREVLATLRQAGPGWQSQVNPILRTALGLDRPPMVDIVGMGPRPVDTTVEDAQAAKAVATFAEQTTPASGL